MAETIDAPGGPPEVEVESAFAIEQFLFVNGTFLGTVPPGQTRLFELPEGKVVLVSADAKDGANPARVELEAVIGRRTRLSILPKL